MELPHFVKIADDGIAELYLDHTLLSSARMCESRFMLDHVYNYRSKGLLSWPLAYGIVMHESMEFLYKIIMQGTVDKNFMLNAWLDFAKMTWTINGMEKYEGLPQYKAIGGMKGFITTLAQYYTFYLMQTDNLKPVALEIPFGKAKEVPLLTDPSKYPFAPFRLYLSGRMDFIFDNGKNLGPLDHKTFSMAGKNPMLTYEVQEGMTGYIYAMQYMYKLLQPEFAAANPTQVYERQTNILWLNFILTKLEPDMNKKFQRIPLFKTQEQLEDWRMRQIGTASKIYDLLFKARPADFNASVCTNYWHGMCPYQPVHRLGSKREQEIILSKDFEVVKAWNPELVQIGE